MNITYERAIALLKNCIVWEINDTSETEYALSDLWEMGFSNEELKELGFEWMLDVEDEN